MRSIGLGEILLILAWLVFWFIGCGGMFWLFVYLRNKGNQRRLEMIHQERMAAMEKGIPLPELPDLHIRSRRDPGSRRNAPLAAGIIFAALGVGGMVALQLSPIDRVHDLWTLPLPLVFLGGGQLLYYYLTRNRAD